ncbi:MAG: RNA polymerase sigma factor [Bacteroidales bacterium]|nr:RNA polymerase sigma factor [Bacteroidales bacterium]
MTQTETYSLIQHCIKRDRQAEFQLYHYFAPRLLPVCRRYARSLEDAEDILQEGFIKVFRYLADFSFKGTFESWLRRIMVTTALNFYKRKKITYTENELTYLPDSVVSEHSVTSAVYHQEIQALIELLPLGYKRVFQLNVIEGFTHKEIGSMLNISENTSKSQLTRARASLRKSYSHRMKEHIPNKYFT